ncbi:MAG: universal stress protein [bacterium]|nr:universal stress protein [bacterium]
MADHTTLDRILVGYDGQDRSVPAVQVALELRRALGSKVEILYVSDIRDPALPSPGHDALEHLWEEEERAARDHARERLASILTRSDLSVDELLHLDIGSPPQILVERTQESDPDLVVIGPHAKRGRFDFGSTARAIMHRAKSNVWVQPGPFQPVKRILVPTDLSEHSLHALDVALGLAKGLKAEITLLHAYVPPVFSYSSQAIEADAATMVEVIEADRSNDRASFERVQAKLDWQGVAHVPLWLEGDAGEVAVEQGAEHDLVVLGTHGRTGLSAALLGNVAYGVIRDSETPVLAVRLPRRRWLLGSG